MSGKRSKIEDKIILEDVYKLLTRKDDFLHIIKIMADLFVQAYPNDLKVRNLIKRDYSSPPGIKPPFLQTNRTGRSGVPLLLLHMPFGVTGSK